jgi:hypothetical protein
VGVAALIVPTIVNEYVDPQPLPRITLATDAGTVSGLLITENADRYVITRRPDSLEMYPSAHVRRAVIEVRHRRRQQPVWRTIIR